MWTAETSKLQKWFLLFFLDKEILITNTNYFTYLQRSLTQLAIYKYGSIYSWQLKKGNCNNIWHLKKIACAEKDGSRQHMFKDTWALTFFLLIYLQVSLLLPVNRRQFTLISFNQHFPNYIFAQWVLLPWNSLHYSFWNVFKLFLLHLHSLNLTVFKYVASVPKNA